MANRPSRCCGAYQGPLHLLVTEIIMRDVGSAACGQGGGAASRPEVLFMSGYADEAIVRHGVLEEDASFLSKPFSPVDLARRVRNVLGER